MDYAFGLSLYLPILLFLIDGCMTDDTSPTSVPAVPYPSVAGNWTGTAIRDFGVGDATTYALNASITQEADSFGGNWLWTGPRGTIKASFKGAIRTTRAMALEETSFEILNSIDSSQYWTVGNHCAKVSSKGDTISGSCGYYPIGTFVLVKK
jgi:hypothetical protein